MCIFFFNKSAPCCPDSQRMWGDFILMVDLYTPPSNQKWDSLSLCLTLGPTSFSLLDLYSASFCFLWVFFSQWDKPSYMPPTSELTFTYCNFKSLCVRLVFMFLHNISRNYFFPPHRQYLSLSPPPVLTEYKPMVIFSLPLWKFYLTSKPQFPYPWVIPS